jgi:hypothetical protein
MPRIHAKNSFSSCKSTRDSFQRSAQSCQREFVNPSTLQSKRYYFYAKFRLKLLGLLLLKELMCTPLRKREPTTGAARPLSQKKKSFSIHSDFIFCILNEKQIFSTLKDSKSTSPYYIAETLRIFNVLLTTLQRS